MRVEMLIRRVVDGRVVLSVEMVDTYAEKTKEIPTIILRRKEDDCKRDSPTKT